MIQTWVKRPPAKLAADQVCILRKGHGLTDAQIEHEYRHLESFDAVVVLADMDRTAIESEASYKRRAKEVLHTLRLPVYSVDALWLRSNATTARFLKMWRDEDKLSEDKELALLVALYQAKLWTWALPAWRNRADTH